jgi:ppGpp synthetase/RelA/SpoT-type nucleotidyltranferase
MSDDDESPSSRADQYERLEPVYEAFVDKLESLLEDRLDSIGVPYASVASWTLSPDRYESRLFRSERAQRLQTAASRTADESCAGVRVVTYTTAYVDDVVALLYDEFSVEADAGNHSPAHADAWRNWIDAGTSDYALLRYVVALTEQRSVLPEWKPYEDLRVNVDVLTVLQEAWRRIDWDLPYYSGKTYSSLSRHALETIVDHLDAADRALIEFRDATNEVEREYSDTIANDNFDLELNGDSLRAYLAGAEPISTLTEMAIDAGMRRDDEYEPDSTNVEKLVWLARVNGIETLDGLHRFVRETLERAPRVLGQITDVSTQRGFVPWALSTSIVTWLLLVLCRADTTTVQLLEYHDALEYALNTLIGNQMPGDPSPEPS